MNILGVSVHVLRGSEVLGHIGHVIDRGAKEMILNVNAHAMNLAVENDWMMKLLNRAGLVFCDGAGVQLAARILGQRIPERITYADWVWRLGAYCAEHGYTLFFLGSRASTVQQAATRMVAQFPSIRILGVRDGYFDKSPGSCENERVLEQINRLAPNVLVVGFGMPLQERWLMENWERIDVNVGLTGGAVFDYMSGELRRAPEWMTANGLEWLGRLIIEPKRLWKRYVLGNPLFICRVVMQRLGAWHRG